MLRQAFCSVFLSIILCCNVYRYGKTHATDETSLNDILQAPSMIFMSIFCRSFIDKASTILVRNVDELGDAMEPVFLASIVFALTEYLLLLIYAYKIFDYFVIQPFFRIFRIIVVISVVILWVAGFLPWQGTRQ